MIVAVTGHREIARASVPTVELAIADVLAEMPTEIRFGGAAGADTIALVAAYSARGHRRLPRLTVYLPFGVEDQPGAARHAIHRCADGIVTLGLPRSRYAYLRRNDAMLDGADLLLAFTAGLDKGGTVYTIRKAQDMGLSVREIAVSCPARRQRTFDDLLEAAAASRIPMPGNAFVIAPYVSASAGDDPLSDAVRTAKAGSASKETIDALGRLVAEAIRDTPGLADADAIAAMPRRRPGMPSDMWPVALVAGRRLGIPVLRDWIARVAEPEGGRVWMRRKRHKPQAHAASMVAGPAAPGWGDVTVRPRKVVVLDNVLTTGATMAGAMAAVLRDTDTEPVGLALLYSPDAEARVLRTRRAA